MIPHFLTEAVLRNSRRRAANRPAQIQARKEQAFQEIERLVAEFRGIDPALGRIVLFGSLAEDRVRSLDFDIDLSFEGMEYYRCVAAAMKSEFKIDLVDYRVCAAHIREAIDTRGKVVYAAGS